MRLGAIKRMIECCIVFVILIVYYFYVRLSESVVLWYMME